MINWNTIPMVYNDSFTYMEWLGKLTYIVNNHESRLNAAEKNIKDLTITIAEILAAQRAIDDWKNNTVDPFIDTITDWKADTVDPFIASVTVDIADLKEGLTNEAATRRNADNAIWDKLNETSATADAAYAKADRISIDLENIGSIRYFIEETIDQEVSGTNTIATIVVPDEEWSTVDVRGHYGTTEFRITGQRNATTVTSGDYTYSYDTATKTITLTIANAPTLDRLDFILYKGALTPDEQEQRDQEYYESMDANGDETLDSSDSAMILGFYAALQGGQIPASYGRGKDAWVYYATTIKPNLNENAYPDINGDGYLDSSDSAMILKYYSWVQGQGLENNGETLRLWRETL